MGLTAPRQRPAPERPTVARARRKLVDDVAGLLRKLPRRRRPRKPMDPRHQQRCIDYYVATHSAQELARMLVELEYAEGHLPPLEPDDG